MKIITTCLLILIASVTFNTDSKSQDWFKNHNLEEKIKGFIVGMAGDTLHGYIVYDYPIVMQKKVSIYFDQSDVEKKNFGPGDIRSYYLEGKNWMSSDVMTETYNGRFKFSRFGIEVSSNGPVSLIRFYDEMDKHKKKMNSEEADIIFEKIPLEQKVGSLKYLYISKLSEPAEKIDSKSFNKDFISNMKNYIGDDEVLYGKIINKELTVNDIYIIVEEYNSNFNRNFKKQ